MVIPAHVDEVVRGELEVDSPDAGEGEDGDVKVDVERVCALGAGTKLLSVHGGNLRSNKQQLIFD